MKHTNKVALKEIASHNAHYAAISCSYSLANKALGYANALVDAGIFKYSELEEIFDLLTNKCINNSDWIINAINY